MNARRQVIGFGISLQDPPVLDELAQEVGSALGVELRLSEERGLKDDYVGELVGLSLWLRVTEPETYGPPQKTVLIGEPEYGEDFDWVDIGPYIAELLNTRTGRPWTSAGS